MKPCTSVIHQKNRFNVRNFANKLNWPNTDKHGSGTLSCAAMNRLRIQEVAGTNQMPRYTLVTDNPGFYNGAVGNEF
jgi:hypothetical protein